MTDVRGNLKCLKLKIIKINALKCTWQLIIFETRSTETVLVEVTKAYFIRRAVLRRARTFLSSAAQIDV